MNFRPLRKPSQIAFCLMMLLRPGGARGTECERMEYMMGTTALIRVWADDSEACDRALVAGFLTLHRVDGLLSTYQTETPLSQLNRTAHVGWVDVGSDLLEVLRLARMFHNLSEGAFDPTVLPLMRLWGFRGGMPSVPQGHSIQTVLARVGMELVEIDSSRQKVRFARKGVELDFGGIGKGIALDRAADALRTEKARSGFLDLGGNLMAFGPSASGPVAVVNPETAEGLFGTISLSDAAIATSGGYERYIMIEGRRYGHVMDPRSGRPADSLLSATVLARDGATADALSTAVYVLGVEDGVRLVESVDGAEAVLIWSQGGEVRHRVTEGLRSRFEGP